MAVTLRVTYHSGSTSVRIDILATQCYRASSVETGLGNILYSFSFLNVMEDNPARRWFSCKEGGVRVNM